MELNPDGSLSKDIDFFFGNPYKGVSVLGMSIRSVAHELKSILMRRAKPEYVRMYVCMSRDPRPMCRMSASAA